MGRILVMGGASLLGARLAERHLDRRDEVFSVDDLSRGSFATIAHLRRRSGFAFVEHDVGDRSRVHDSVPFDAIYHLALPSSRGACEADPVHAAVTSVMGTLHALEIAAEHRARIVLATSIERWGPGVRCAESLAFEFARTRGVDVRLVRVASVYGPRMSLDDKSPLLDLVIRAVRGADLLEAPSPAASCGERHALCWVDDGVETLVRTMELERRVAAVAAPLVEASYGDLVRAVLEASSATTDIGAPDVRCERAAAPSWSATLTTPEAIPATLLFGQPAALPLASGVAHLVRWVRDRIGGFDLVRTSGFFGPSPARGEPAEAPAEEAG
jgi:UDP-glucuronate decarboxylase